MKGHPLRVVWVNDPHLLKNRPVPKNDKELLDFAKECLRLHAQGPMRRICQTRHSLLEKPCSKQDEEVPLENGCSEKCSAASITSLSELRDLAGQDGEEERRTWQPDLVRLDFFSGFGEALKALAQSDRLRGYDAFIIDYTPETEWPGNRLSPDEANAHGIYWRNGLISGADVVRWLTERQVPGTIILATKDDPTAEKLHRHRIDMFLPDLNVSSSSGAFKGPLVVAEMKRRLREPGTALPPAREVKVFDIRSESVAMPSREELVVDLSARATHEESGSPCLRLIGPEPESLVELQENGALRLRRLIRMADYMLPEDDAATKLEHFYPKHLPVGGSGLDYFPGKRTADLGRTSLILWGELKQMETHATKGRDAFMVRGAIRALTDHRKAWIVAARREAMDPSDEPGDDEETPITPPVGDEVWADILVSSEQEWLALARGIECLHEAAGAAVQHHRDLALTQADEQFLLAGEWRCREAHLIQKDDDLEYLLMPDVGTLCVSIARGDSSNQIGESASEISTNIVAALGALASKGEDFTRQTLKWAFLLSPITQALKGILQGEKATLGLTEAVLRAYADTIDGPGYVLRESLYRRARS